MLKYKCWNCGLVWRSTIIEVKECPSCTGKPTVLRPDEIVEYKHHGTSVCVRKHLLGLHKEHCLCWICAHFAPDGSRAKNCPIANRLFKICVDYNVVTPVWECAAFEMLQ